MEIRHFLLAGIFSGVLQKLLETSSEVGGYAGVIGGMMGEVIANGAPSQGKVMLSFFVSASFRFLIT